MVTWVLTIHVRITIIITISFVTDQYVGHLLILANTRLIELVEPIVKTAQLLLDELSIRSLFKRDDQDDGLDVSVVYLNDRSVQFLAGRIPQLEIDFMFYV